MGNQVHKVTQLHNTIYRMARMHSRHAAHEDAQWLALRGWLEDRETQWEECHKDNVLRGTGIADMGAGVLAKARVHEVALSQDARKEGRDVTASQDGASLEALQHAGAMQGGEPEKRQLLQLQQKPKPKLKLTLQPEPQHEPKPIPKPTPIPGRTWESVQPHHERQWAPGGTGPTPMT